MNYPKPPWRALIPQIRFITISRVRCEPLRRLAQALERLVVWPTC